MDLNEIKEIIKREGGKIVIVENNKPQMVIMSFDEWRRAPRPEPSSSQSVPQEERAPSVQAGQALRPTPPRVEEKTEELTIDDLPL
ncbi:MAG: type II toxin-antitoxin system prevent-host-death family antitoxin [Candidatus Wildermuthbacteria bacterium]|nr:type II toxin-antitoxin system prevent-host-death family antitoxin [Candidatus Wildermuthbacteria bacterium]